MNTSIRAALATTLATAALTLATAAPAAAQHYDTSVGWGGGYVQWANFVDAGEDSPRDIGLGGTWVAVLSAESWQLNRWVGLRAGGFYSHGTLTLPASDNDASAYGLEVAALLRLLPPGERRLATVYGIAGGGVTWFDMGEGNDVLIPGGNVTFSEDDARQWALLGGAGVEVLTGLRAMDGEIGVRLEGVDHMVMGRPFRPLGGSDPGMTHNPRVTLTLFAGVPGLF